MMMRFRTQLEINPPYVQSEEDARLALQLYNKLHRVLTDALPGDQFALCDTSEMTLSNRDFIYVGITGFQTIDLAKLSAHLTSNFGFQGVDWNFKFSPQIRSSTTYDGEFRLRRLARAKKPFVHRIKDVVFATLFVGNIVGLGFYLLWPRVMVGTTTATATSQ